MRLHTFKKIYFIFCFCLCWVFITGCGLPLVVASRSYFLVVVQGLLIAVPSLVVENKLEGVQASVVAALGLSRCGLWVWALECRLSCGTPVQMPHNIVGSSQTRN